MEYRKFGELDWNVSVLGFGVMRLPSIDEDPADIDEATAIKMIRYAIDKGVNYLDLGYPYDMSLYERQSRIVGRALQDGYRQKIRITATLSTFSMKTSTDFDRCLNKQLKWLKVDRLDFYLLGRLNRDNWPALESLGVLNVAEKAMIDGRIGHLGFSFHDHFQVLRDILNAYDNWELGQFQYSYMDINHDPGFSGIKYAADQGLAVVVTEPLRWGRLTKEPPVPVAKVWASAPQRRSLTEWGLRWVWNHPEVSVVVSDMSTIEQVKENIDRADCAQPDSLTVRELVLLNRIRDAYQALKVVPCTSCRACMPCPMGIDVPRIFELYNDAVMYNDIKTTRSIYRAEQHDINRCSECNICANACAKRLTMLEYLRAARRLLNETEG
jgi:predicted aldo/keto reductase-like oxidoreductase